MQVRHQRDRRMVEEFGVERLIFSIIIERFRILQVALVLRKNGLAILDESERRLEFAAHGEKLGRCFKTARQRDRGRCETSGAA